jgi:formate dehydrogenase iron-sulfur subunit
MPTLTTNLKHQPATHRPDSTVHPSDLISQLLQEQSTLTAVEEFSTWHKAYTEPEQVQYYRNLMPASMPLPGQQLAFEVDLDKCSGCKACVVACHSLNGLDEGESFRDVGLLLASSDSVARFQHVTTACHHCIDPGCLSACPVNAYEKDPVTGIVRHLDDQCFGCQYCTLACPYEVPKYHAAKGIVRKCDMCTQRLSAGEAPACVQACPHQAIMIRTIDIAAARADANAGTFLPNSPDPDFTIPTTRYVGKATTSSAMRAGTYAVQPLEHAHVPLILLLVLSQLAVGIVIMVLMLNSFVEWDQFVVVDGRTSNNSSTIEGTLANSSTRMSAVGQTFAGHTLRDAILGFAAGVAALSAISSTLHLGRPQFAYRAILGIRHSWLSREIAAFGVFIALSYLSALLSWNDSAWLNLSLSAAALAGLVGILSSAMIYHVTHRPFWNVTRSLPAFLAAVFGMGSIVVLWTLSFIGIDAGSEIHRLLACTAVVCALVKLCLLVNAVRQNTIVETSQLLNPRLRTDVQRQAAGNVVFMVLCITLSLWPVGTHVTLIATLAICGALCAEFTERYLFFRAVVPLRMPGVLK